jgi:hypothetical protein
LSSDGHQLAVLSGLTVYIYDLNHLMSPTPSTSFLYRDTQESDEHYTGTFAIASIRLNVPEYKDRSDSSIDDECSFGRSNMWWLSSHYVLISWDHYARLFDLRTGEPVATIYTNEQLPSINVLPIHVMDNDSTSSGHFTYQHRSNDPMDGPTKDTTNRSSFTHFTPSGRHHMTAWHITASLNTPIREWIYDEPADIQWVNRSMIAIASKSGVITLWPMTINPNDGRYSLPAVRSITMAPDAGVESNDLIDRLHVMYPSLDVIRPTMEWIGVTLIPYGIPLPLLPIITAYLIH